MDHIAEPDCESRKRFFCSWHASVAGFEDVLARLRSGVVPEDDTHRLINVSSGKYVYRCQDGGYDFAYKSQDGKAFWRYLFRASLPLRECRNYLILKKLNIPVPQVLATGDTRTCFILRESFLITSFLDGTADGRIFMPRGKFREGYDALRHAYCEKNLILMARLHDAGYFHKASHPRNFLFRGDTPENMEIFWIDVARLRKAKNLRRAIVVDLHTFFRDMKLQQQEVMELLELYVNTAQNHVFSSADGIMKELINFKRRAFSRHKYKLFADA